MEKEDFLLVLMIIMFGITVAIDISINGLSNFKGDDLLRSLKDFLF